MGANSDRDAEGPLRTPLTGAFRSHTSLEAQSEKLPRQDRFGPAFPGFAGIFGPPENLGTLDRPRLCRFSAIRSLCDQWAFKPGRGDWFVVTP